MRLNVLPERTIGGFGVGDGVARGSAGSVARGVLWLGSRQAVNAEMSGCNDPAETMLLGNLHGPRLLELLNAAGI
jgi:hypothetical protein